MRLAGSVSAKIFFAAKQLFTSYDHMTAECSPSAQESACVVKLFLLLRGCARQCMPCALPIPFCSCCMVCVPALSAQVVIHATWWRRQLNKHHGGSTTHAV